MASNTSTVVGVFNDYSAAQQAATQLGDNGIPQSSIHIQSDNRTAAAGRQDNSTPEQEGGVSGFFHRLFSSGDADTKGAGSRYSEAVQSGRAVVVVDAAGAEAERAAALLHQYGAIDFEDYGTAGADNRAVPTAGTSAGTSAGKSAASSSIPVIDEQLKVGKRQVERGGVRVYSRMTERPVEEKITLHDEHVRVDRRPADRAIGDAELSAMRDQSFEMTETVEEPVIEKRARVTEEVTIGKEATERTQTIRDTVRHTDVKVERFGNAEGETSGDSDFRQDWQKNYASQGGEYSTYAPGYNYGYRQASDPQFYGRSWSDAEPELRAGYERDNPGSAWERMKNSIRYGWDKTTGTAGR